MTWGQNFRERCRKDGSRHVGKKTAALRASFFRIFEKSEVGLNTPPPPIRARVNCGHTSNLIRPLCCVIMSALMHEDNDLFVKQEQYGEQLRRHRWF